MFGDNGNRLKKYEKNTMAVSELTKLSHAIRHWKIARNVRVCRVPVEGQWNSVH